MTQGLPRLDPPLPLATPKGSALAHVMIDYGAEHDLVWFCIQNDGGEIWCWNNRDVRGHENISMKRGAPQWAS